MDPIEDLGLRPEVKKERQFRRTVLLQIYLPILAALALFVVLGLSIGSSDYGSPSVWGDIALLFLLLPLLVIILLVIVAVVALGVGVGRLPRWVRIGGARAGAFVDAVGAGVKRAADGAARPVILIHGAAAVVRRAGELFGSFFRPR